MTNNRRTNPTGTRTQARLSVGLVLLVLVVAGLGVSEAHVSVVTGHSVFVNADGYDQCLASIAGILRLRVMWFNDQVLVDRFDGKGNFIYAIEHGAPDPRGQRLVYSGTTYDFVDPNGAKWQVREAYWDHRARTGHSTDQGIPGYDYGVGEVNATGHLGTLRYYTWIVEVGEPIQDVYNGGHPHDYYNFVNLVDTCKMNAERSGLAHHNQSDPNDPNYQTSGHPVNETSDHVHETYLMDLYVGKEPTLVPLGCFENPNGECREPPNDVWAGASWASQWANNPDEYQYRNDRISDGNDDDSGS